MQEVYFAKGIKLYMCFVVLDKPFDRVPRKVLEWAMMKKGIPEVLVRSVMRCMRELGQGLEWILICQRSFRLKWGCTDPWCKGLKVNLGKTHVIVCGGITKDGMSKSKVDQCGICSL